MNPNVIDQLRSLEQILADSDLSTRDQDRALRTVIEMLDPTKKRELQAYNVRWETEEVYAPTPREAAQIALDAITNTTTFAHVFDITKEDGTTYRIDLDNVDEDDYGEGDGADESKQNVLN